MSRILLTGLLLLLSTLSNAVKINDNLSYADMVSGTTGLVGGYTSEATFSDFRSNINNLSTDQYSNIDLSLETLESGLNYQTYRDNDSVFETERINHLATNGPVGDLIEGNVLRSFGNYVFGVTTDENGDLMITGGIPGELIGGIGQQLVNVEEGISANWLDNNVSCVQQVEDYVSGNIAIL